jgi:hypothetical protein
VTPGVIPTVQVISREPVGPYDRAILQTDDVGALRDWLNENDFQIPDAIDKKLQPYIDAGEVFIVIKLLADRGFGGDGGCLQAKPRGTVSGVML